MWRHLLHRMETAVHPGLRRQVVPTKLIHGIFCDSKIGGFDEGEVLCLIPFSHSLSANIAAASPWGPGLMDAVSSYNVLSDGVQVEYSKESAITTIFCALTMLSERVPIGDYLNWISIECANDADFRSVLGDAQYEQLQTIKRLNESIILALCKDAAATGLQIPSEVMKRAHNICSSRCVDVPRSHAIFGGPALVPFVDLINHDPGEPNVAVYMDTQQSAAAAVQCSKSFPPELWAQVNESPCPFYVVVRAEKDICNGQELHYCYVDKHDDSFRNPLFWAARFHFCP